MPNKIRKIAFLGSDYSFSHIGALKYCHKFKPREQFEFLGCKTIVEVVKAVDSGKADYGLIPIWNTSKYYIHIAQEQILKSKNIGIVDNFKMKVNLYLLSTNDDINKIRVIYTIKHVFAQCGDWLSKNLPNVKLKEAKSTAFGIRKALSKKHYGAIGSKQAASYYKLNVLAQNIQNKGNETLFLVMQRKPSYERRTSNFTLLAFPLPDFYKTRTEITPLLMEHLLYPTQEWPLSLESTDAKWNFMEIPGHLTNLNVKTFISILKKQLRHSLVLGCYGISITDRLNTLYSFDSE